MLLGDVIIVTVILLLIGLKAGTWLQTQATMQGRVSSAIRANFPTFCTDGEILVTSLNNNLWGIRCDSWLKNPAGFYGIVTVVDVDQCTTRYPMVSTLGVYYAEFEALNKSNGQRLAFCP
jgi:hypothetical protein